MSVLINGQFAPIIGNICMDQMLVDVTDIKEVKQGDIAVLIGKSGDLEITAYDLAEQTESISGQQTSEQTVRAGEQPGQCSQNIYIAQANQKAQQDQARKVSRNRCGDDRRGTHGHGSDGSNR